MSGVQGIGIGRALQKARQLRGKSIEEAARETRMRAEYIEALEGEEFEALLGDVYVRGSLRSYSTYLGLDPSKVLTIYNRHFGEPQPTLPHVAPAPIRSPRSAHPHLPQLVRHHPSWAFLIGVALLVLAVFAAAGLLSRSRGAPTSGATGKVTPSIEVQPATVEVAIHAVKAVRVTVTTDGRVAFQGLLRKNEARTFLGNQSIQIALEKGGLASITVNGHDVGKPGNSKAPLTVEYTPESFGGTSSAKSP
jgi:cytoskeleton protein RodZ